MRVQMLTGSLSLFLVPLGHGRLGDGETARRHAVRALYSPMAIVKGVIDLITAGDRVFTPRVDP